jgi:hypothetical protein
VSNSATNLFDELEYKSSKMKVDLPYGGSPKYNLHNLNFIAEKFGYSILKSLYSKEVYKTSANQAKGFFKNKEKEFNSVYGHLIQDGFNYRIATTIDLDKKIVQIPESEQELFKPENRLFFFKNNFFVILDSSRCSKYVDYYYNDVNNLTIDLARMIEREDYINFGLLDGNKIISAKGTFDKDLNSVSEKFLKASLKGCTAFARPKYYAIHKNRSIFEGQSFASAETLIKELNLNNSVSWICRISKKNADVYETLSNRSFLSQDVASFKELNNYIIIKSDDKNFLKEAYRHFIEVQTDVDALEKVAYAENSKTCKVSDALKLFNCKSKEERSFYKDQLKLLKKNMRNNFSVNNIKEKIELNEIMRFTYEDGKDYNFYSWVKNWQQ